MAMTDREVGYVQGRLDRQTGISLASREKLAEWDTHSDEWKAGWGEGYDVDTWSCGFCDKPTPEGERLCDSCKETARRT